MSRAIARPVLALLCLLASLVAMPAAAQIHVSFHSFNGSILAGRYPHTFVVFEGALESNGQPIFENYGFSAKSIGPSVLSGPVEHVIFSEKEKYVRNTNVHFTLPIDDATYFRMREEIARWRDAPGKFYDLKTRNCIHFVGRMAEMVGLKVDYPEDLLRKPRAWLNRVGTLNPRIGAIAFR